MTGKCIPVSNPTFYGELASCLHVLRLTRDGASVLKKRVLDDERVRAAIVDELVLVAGFQGDVLHVPLHLKLLVVQFAGEGRLRVFRSRHVVEFG